MEELTCPRCGATSVATFYGPCARCRAELEDGRTIVRPGCELAGVDELVDELVEDGTPANLAGPGTAPAPLPAAAGVPAGDPPDVGAVPLSGRRTLRVIRDLPARHPVVLDWSTGALYGEAGRLAVVTPTGDLGAVLAAAVRVGADRVLVVGVEAPALLDQWSTSRPPVGWQPEAHYLDGDRPILRYAPVRADELARRSGIENRPVTVGTAAQWCGDVDQVEHVAAALRWARDAIDDAFPGRGRLLASPATTGRELVARCVPAGDGFPVLDDDVQDLIRETSPQHRMELCQPAGMQLPGLHELDMRLAYGALCWGLPAGAPEWHRGEPAGWRPQQRGRYFASWRVPDTWDHVGVLPHRTADGWRWADRPGELGRGWIDGCELALARDLGWHVEVAEAIVWPDRAGDPLRVWADRLAQIASDAERQGDTGRMPRQASRAARAAIRACLVHGLGALHGTPRRITHTIAGDAGEAPPAGAPYRLVWETGAIVWQELRAPAWPAMSHPEWTAAVWARARCRLLRGPGGLGALALSRHELVGFRGDAIYLAHDPDWADTGRPGGWRHKGDPLGPFTMPETLPELDVLRRQGADPVRGLAAARRALQAHTAADPAPVGASS